MSIIIIQYKELGIIPLSGNNNLSESNFSKQTLKYTTESTLTANIHKSKTISSVHDYNAESPLIIVVFRFTVDRTLDNYMFSVNSPKTIGKIPFFIKFFRYIFPITQISPQLKNKKK